MKIKLFLFYAALFAISCSSDDGGAATAKTNLKVMSFNIRYSNTIDTGDNAWDARREPLYGSDPRREARCDRFSGARVPTSMTS